MTAPPARPKLYHITHVDNLAAIAKEGVLVSDAAMIARGGPSQAIGMSEIKRRRIEELEVSCHPGTKVGDYVPFYFCPRSVMLYVIHCANHPDLTYRGGQGPIVHLEADLHAVIAWARANGRRWAFSLSNAGAYYAELRCRPEDLDQLDWNAISATDFRSAQVKEGKQAELLVHESFPFALVERVGVCSPAIRASALTAVGMASQPAIEVCPAWYF
ncbi:MAG: DUF4433 domain-containing protein [Deltaproteobacteria bacterium]|nr:DUF4433 domain-containing protein [Deltaproteobacteria bacterium]